MTKVLIAAGGTGGHIFPALALGDAINKHHPGVVFQFLCGERDLERQVYARNGIEPIVFPARQITGGFAGRVAGFWAALANTVRGIRLVSRERFDVIIGMGGYVSGPAVLAGILLRRKTVIHEANSIPGKTNRWLASHVKMCAIHFPVTAERLRSRRIARVGMPIRENVTAGTRDEGLSAFDLDAQKRTLLILGGSQGARFLYDTLMQAIPLTDIPEHADVQILWSTGATNFSELESRLRSIGLRHVSVKLVPFIERMDLALAVADVAVARAGASTIAELLACGIYAIYVPFPSAIYDHQTQNAMQVVRANAGAMISEHELSPERAAHEITTVLARTAIGQRIRIPPELDSREAAARLSDLCVGSA